VDGRVDDALPFKKYNERVDGMDMDTFGFDENGRRATEQQLV
jgi:hypothetical protein